VATVAKRPAVEGEREGDDVPRASPFARVGALGGHTITLIGAVLAAVISATTLVFNLWPGLKPDPKEKVGADLSTVAFDQNVTLGQYLKREGVPAKLEPGEKPGDMGNVFYVKAQIEGFKRSSLHLAWFTYNADNRYRCLEPKLRSSAPAEVIFNPEAPINTQVAEVWVPTPDLTGNFFVRFQLYTGQVLLNFTDSHTYRVQSLDHPLSKASCAS
jgi:hypothetical protein